MLWVECKGSKMRIYLVDLVKDDLQRPIEIPEVGTISVGRSKLSDM